MLELGNVVAKLPAPGVVVVVVELLGSHGIEHGTQVFPKRVVDSVLRPHKLAVRLCSRAKLYTELLRNQGDEVLFEVNFPIAVLSQHYEKWGSYLHMLLQKVPTIVSNVGGLNKNFRESNVNIKPH